jgi:hypothetical protein
VPSRDEAKRPAQRRAEAAGHPEQGRRCIRFLG